MRFDTGRLLDRWASLGLAGAVALLGPLAGADTEALPGFDDAVRRISEHLVGYSDVDPGDAADGALRGLLSVMDPHAVIVDPSEEEAPETEPEESEPNRSQAVAESFVYLGLTTLPPDAADLLDEPGITADACDGVILDLRRTSGTDLSQAAVFVSRFLEPGTRVFSVEGPGGRSEMDYDAANGSSAWRETPLVILIGQETGPAAEAVAGGLRDVRRAVLIGFPTPGGAVQREPVALGDGRVIRLATRRVRFPSGAVLFPLGAQPDIPIREDDLAEPPPPLPPGDAEPPDEIVPNDETPDEPGDLPTETSDTDENAAAAAADAAAEAELELLDDPTVRVALDILRGLRALRIRP